MSYTVAFSVSSLYVVNNFISFLFKIFWKDFVGLWTTLILCSWHNLLVVSEIFSMYGRFILFYGLWWLCSSWLHWKALVMMWIPNEMSTHFIEGYYKGCLIPSLWSSWNIQTSLDIQACLKALLYWAVGLLLWYCITWFILLFKIPEYEVCLYYLGWWEYLGMVVCYSFLPL